MYLPLFLFEMKTDRREKIAAVIKNLNRESSPWYPFDGAFQKLISIGIRDLITLIIIFISSAIYIYSNDFRGTAQYQRCIILIGLVFYCVFTVVLNNIKPLTP